MHLQVPGAETTQPSSGWLFCVFNQLNLKNLKKTVFPMIQDKHFTVDHITHIFSLLVSVCHCGCIMLILCVNMIKRLRHCIKKEYGCLTPPFFSLHLSLYARHPQCHHLLNSAVHGISAQHCVCCPYCVSVCVTWGCLQWNRWTE